MNYRVCVKYLLAMFIIFIFSINLYGQPKTYYVATDGNDTHTGLSLDQPFLTLAKAVGVMAAGDTIYMRGGTYSLSTVISISKSGTNSAKYNLIAYPGDVARPLLNCSTQSFGTKGVNLSGSYWYIKGIDIYKSGDNGMYISGSNNIVEFCRFFENQDSGLQLSGGAANNKVLNCDSYFNADPTDYGDADGFACKMDVGTGNYFYGCRSWFNVDDGWDGYMRGATGVTTTLENCWTWGNGYFKDGTDAGAAANGNGFKMGGSDTKNLVHNFIVKNCLAFYNKAKGFDQNSNAGSITLYNCTSFHNTGKDYMLNSSSVTYDASSVFTVINCLALGTSGTSFRTSTILTTNNFSASASDYLSIDTTGISGQRKSDGSLPDVTFMHLASGSQFINAGTDVGLPFNGSAPDLGCFEASIVSSLAEDHQSTRTIGFQLNQNYPNPFNPTTNISFMLAQDGFTTLKIYDILGREIVTLVNKNMKAGVLNSLSFNASKLSSGIYFSRLENSGNVQFKKMMLLK
jgi:hypothetical protein